jgi:two-component system sensor histidine kinase RpfC
MALFHGMPSDWRPAEVSIVLSLVGFFAIALMIFGAICVWPQKNVPRRLIGMVADAGGATWYMCVAGEYSFSMIGLYLFITFGNGFRYGRRYLFGCQALCLAGCTAVLLFVPYWQEHRPAGSGMLIALVVLPLYVSTLLKRIQAERARAEEANRAKTTFLANMSHEMRTPLNGIVGVVDLMRTTALSVQQSELVRLLGHSIAVLRSLVDDVLDISKIEAGRLTIEVAPFDLHSTVNGLLQLLRPHAQSKGLSLRAAVDPLLEYQLRGDSHHLRQILLNLLGNAIKFTERGEVALSISMLSETQEGVTARFEVKDTGIGIAPDALPRIFERFVQADQSTTRKYGGTGLGTTIAKQLVELMGGSIGVTSTLGEGSTFWFELPLLRDPQPGTDSSSLPGVPVNAVVLVVAEGLDAENARRVVHEAGEHVELVSPADSFSRVLDSISNSDSSIRAVMAACPVDVACTAFTTTLNRLGPGSVPLLYVASDSLSVVDSARLRSIPGVAVLPRTASGRAVSNAIHAARAGTDREGSALDLTAVLAEARRKLRILVAEDNATNQAIISQLLGNAGHEVFVVSDGEQALDIYERESPDLAILDFNMPLRTGIEVIQAIRVLEPPGQRMPAVILSASVTMEARQRAKSAGADEFISKPFDAVQLLRRIDVLGKNVRGDVVLRSASVSQPRAGVAARKAVADEAGTLVDARRLEELEDIARDPGFVAELLRGFRSDVEGLFARLDACLAGDGGAENGRHVSDLMHTLKGAAVGVGAKQLASLCTSLDSATASHMEPADLKARASEMRQCFDQTVAYLADYVKRHHQLTL